MAQGRSEPAPPLPGRDRDDSAAVTSDPSVTLIMAPGNTRAYAAGVTPGRLSGRTRPVSPRVQLGEAEPLFLKTLPLRGDLAQLRVEVDDLLMVGGVGG